MYLGHAVLVQVHHRRVSNALKHGVGGRVVVNVLRLEQLVEEAAVEQRAHNVGEDWVCVARQERSELECYRKKKKKGKNEEEEEEEDGGKRGGEGGGK